MKLKLPAFDEDPPKLDVVLAAHVTNALMNLPCRRVDLLRKAEKIDHNWTYDSLIRELSIKEVSVVSQYLS